MTADDLHRPVAEGRRFRVGIVGTGSISGAYGAHIAANPALEIVAATDLDPARAAAFASEHGGRAVATLDALLAEDIDVVINLTVQAEHYRVTKAALEAGRHVHVEKPLALHSSEAWELVELARSRGLRLSCSPFTLLGEAQQTAWRLIRDGRIGQVRLVYAQVDWGRIESWHPAPRPFYEVGPLSDVGVYPLAIVTALLGPVARVYAVGRTLLAERTSVDGSRFTVNGPDTWLVTFELQDGTLFRLAASFYTGQQAKGNASIAFHGDTGDVWLGHSVLFDTPVEIAAFGNDEPHETVPPIRPDAPAFDWSRGVEELAEAIAEGRPHRASAEQAAHLVDVFEAVAASAARDGAGVQVTSSFAAPAPMLWAEG